MSDAKQVFSISQFSVTISDFAAKTICSWCFFFFRLFFQDALLVVQHLYCIATCFGNYSQVLSKSSALVMLDFSLMCKSLERIFLTLNRLNLRMTFQVMLIVPFSMYGIAGLTFQEIVLYDLCMMVQSSFRYRAQQLALFFLFQL